MARIRKWVIVALFVVGGLTVGGLAIWWVNSPPGFTILPFRDTDGYMGRIPPLTKLETYPRLVPWKLGSPADVGTTVFMVIAESYACNLGKRGAGQVEETLDRVDIRETADTVTIETWLGPPQGDGFWPGCKGTGTSFPVRVELNKPLGNRRFVDPACALDRHADLGVCESPVSKFQELQFGSRPTVDTP